MSNRDRRESYRVFEFLNRRIGVVASGVAVLAVALALLAPGVANEEQVNFDPTGEIYDIRDRADDVFDSESAVAGARFLVEDPNGIDVLTRDDLLEFKQRSDALRSATKTVQGRALNARLQTGVDLDLGREIDGIFSVADAVDEALIAAGVGNGLEGADDDDVKRVLSDLLAADAPTSTLRFTLSGNARTVLASATGGVVEVWESPAFLAELRYDFDSFDTGAGEDEQSLDAEAWLIEAQTVLRDGNRTLPADADLNVWGVAIDFNTAFQNSFIAGAPFIFLAVALIVLLVGALMRSYWAAAVVAAGLGVTMMTYNGLVALIQLDESPLLQLIVPIAMISFGVDFFIHGAGRTREAQVEGATRERAYPLGMTAVFKALLLAAVTSAAAFLSNAVSGVEAITEFGIGAALALLLAYVFLGLLAPRVLLGIEDRLGGRPADLGLMVTYKILFTVAAVVAGVMVALTVVLPTIGAPFFIVFLGLFVWFPYWWAKRRNAKAMAEGRSLIDEVRGAGHGFVAAGSVVHFLARWRVVTLPVVAVVAVIGVILFTRVERRFEFTDFLPDTSDAAVSLDRLDEHQPGQLGGFGFIYVEGDLTAPDTLASMEATLASLGRPSTETSPSAISIVRAAMASPPAIDAISASTPLTDGDGNGLPDDATQVAAIYDYAVTKGIPNADGVLILRPDVVQRYLSVEGATQATRLEIEIPSWTDDDVIRDARADLQAGADRLRTQLGDEYTIGISGGPITSQAGLQAFIDSMLLSLPIAVALAILIAALVMRSLKYAVTSIVPILLVVAWVYGFMYLADFAINPVTATIAAIAIGVGIDFATHFTVRFREEFEDEASRFPALRRAGEGTGGALALSALTSIIGFWALSLAPTPIFATFGILTAVMIALALLVSLLVLPSLLLVVTPSRKGDERHRLLELHPGPIDEYDPHARATAVRNNHAPVGGD
jgi:predicted RND superfamily exporter protein